MRHATDLVLSRDGLARAAGQLRADEGVYIVYFSVRVDSPLVEVFLGIDEPSLLNGPPSDVSVFNTK